MELGRRHILFQPSPCIKVTMNQTHEHIQYMNKRDTNVLYVLCTNENNHETRQEKNSRSRIFLIVKLILYGSCTQWSELILSICGYKS